MNGERKDDFAQENKKNSATAHYPGLIEQLRAENFDAAYTEDPAGFGNKIYQFLREYIYAYFRYFPYGGNREDSLRHVFHIDGMQLCDYSVTFGSVLRSM